MKTKHSTQNGDGSLRTFFLYFFIVFSLIVVSLSVRVVTLIGQSKYDGKHFLLAVSQNGKVVKVAGFDPSDNVVSVLNLKNSNIQPQTLGRDLGIAQNGTINLNTEDVSGMAVDEILGKVLFTVNSQDSDLTVFDKLRLLYFSKKASSVNSIEESIMLPASDRDMDEIASKLFGDELVLSENVSIRVVNASGTPGLGNRLARVLTNLGANVISVIGSDKPEKISKIQYYFERTYTLDKIAKLLDFPTEPIEKKTITDIIIIIGEQSKSRVSF